MANKEEESACIYDFTVVDADKRVHRMDEYRGKVILIVNVASKCGLAKNSYEDMANLLEKYHKNGLRILLFPCNQFLNQEYSEMSAVRDFAEIYSKQFILMDAVKVKGSDAHPLFKFLSTKLGGFITDSVKWNFTYFLVSRNGTPVKRYGPADRIRLDDSHILSCLDETVS